MFGFTSIKKWFDGVFYGWWIVAASWVMFLICGGISFYGFTTFFNPIADEFNWSAAQVSLAFSLRSLEAGIMAPFIGYIIDKIGVRKVIVFGMVVTGFGFLLLSYTNSLATFYVSFLLLSLGTSCGLGMGQFVAVANWFEKKRTWVMGIMSSGYAFSGIVGPALVVLIARYGWRSTLVMAAVLMWVIGLPLAAMIRHRPEPYGYLPDNEPLSRRFSRDESGKIIGADGELYIEEPEQTGLSVKESLLDRTFWMLIIFGIFTGFSMSAIFVHEMPYLTSVGISRELAGWGILGMTGMSLFGRLGFGWVGDRYDKRYLLAIGAVLQFIGVMIFAYITAPWMIIPFVLFYGPGYASQIPLWPAIRADYFGLKNYGTIGGLQSLSWTLCGIAAPVLAGWVYDEWGTYRPIWLIFGAATVVAVPVVFWIKTKAQGAKIFTYEDTYVR